MYLKYLVDLLQRHLNVNLYCVWLSFNLNTALILAVKSRIVWISPEQKADLGGNATLRCVATGRPTPRVVWKKDGRVLLEGQETANITIDSISREDGGSYECWAINSLANETRTTAINVEGWNIQNASFYTS